MTCRLKNSFVRGAMLLAVLSTGVLPVAAQANDYIVSFEPGTPGGARAAAAARHGAEVRYNFGIIDAIAVTAPNENALRALAGEAGVRSITPDYPVFASQADRASENAIKGKPGGGGGGGTPQVLPLGVQRVGAPLSATSGQGIRVAIVDTGIDLSQADLAPPVGKYNAINSRQSCQDDNGHGTHVAGTVAALNNTRDVVGVAPGASLYCVKVLNSQGSGSWSTIIAGLDWLWNNGNPQVQVVNMSLGGPGTDTDSPLRQAIARLYNSGVVVVVAAGNDPSLDVSQQVPAAYKSYVLTVASTTAVPGTPACGIQVLSDTGSYFTSDGTGVTISAPGEDHEDISQTSQGCYLNSVGILSLKLGGGTTRMSGTSMATPHVSGIVARLLQSPSTYLIPPPAHNGTDVEQVRSYFTQIPAPGADRQGVAPLDSPASSYTFDFYREGIATIK